MFLFCHKSLQDIHSFLYIILFTYHSHLTCESWSDIDLVLALTVSPSVSPGFDAVSRVDSGVCAGAEAGDGSAGVDAGSVYALANLTYERKMKHKIVLSMYPDDNCWGFNVPFRIFSAIPAQQLVFLVLLMIESMEVRTTEPDQLMQYMV